MTQLILTTRYRAPTFIGPYQRLPANARSPCSDNHHSDPRQKGVRQTPDTTTSHSSHIRGYVMKVVDPTLLRITLACRDQEVSAALDRIVENSPTLELAATFQTLTELATTTRGRGSDIAVLDTRMADTVTWLPTRLAGRAILVTTDVRLRADTIAHFARLGIRAVVQFADGVEDLPAAVHSVASGHSWISPTLGWRLLTASRSTNCDGTPTARRAIGHGATSDSASTPGNLTAREMDVLRQIVDGRSNAEIAESLFVTRNTVKYHVRNLLAKYSARDRAHLISLAYRTAIDPRTIPTGRDDSDRTR